MSAVIGFDFGLARIGVAIGSPNSGRAEALTVLRAKNGRPDWGEIEALVADWQPVAFVVGDPSGGVSGADNDATTRLADKLKQFRKSLGTRFGLPVESVDETCTSTEAQALLREQRRAGKPTKIRKGEIDVTAAAVILQSWLAQTRPADTT